MTITNEINKQLKIANYIELSKVTKNKYDAKYYLEKAIDMIQEDDDK